MELPRPRRSFYTNPLLFVETVVGGGDVYEGHMSEVKLDMPVGVSIVPGSKDILACDFEGSAIRRLSWDTNTVSVHCFMFESSCASACKGCLIWCMDPHFMSYVIPFFIFLLPLFCRLQLWLAKSKTSASLTASPFPLQTTLWRTTQVRLIKHWERVKKSPIAVVQVFVCGHAFVCMWPRLL